MTKTTQYYHSHLTFYRSLFGLTVAVGHSLKYTRVWRDTHVRASNRKSRHPTRGLYDPPPRKTNCPRTCPYIASTKSQSPTLRDEGLKLCALFKESLHTFLDACLFEYVRNSIIRGRRVVASVEMTIGYWVDVNRDISEP